MRERSFMVLSPRSFVATAALQRCSHVVPRWLFRSRNSTETIPKLCKTPCEGNRTRIRSVEVDLDGCPVLLPDGRSVDLRRQSTEVLSCRSRSFTIVCGVIWSSPTIVWSNASVTSAERWVGAKRLVHTAKERLQAGSCCRRL